MRVSTMLHSHHDVPTALEGSAPIPAPAHSRHGDGRGIARFAGGMSCPVCGGSEEDPRGSGRRCFGFLTDGWIHCTREEFANGCDFHDGSAAYSPRAKGKCRCGVEHSPAEVADKRPASGKRRGKLVAVYPYHDGDGRVLFEV